MNTLNYFLRIPITCMLSCIALLLFIVKEFESIFAFQFNQFRGFEIHQVIGCNWLHWSGDHLFWDLAMFAVLAAVCESRTPVAFRWTLLFAAIAIPLGVLCMDPSVVSYRGLSGIDTALYGLLVGELLIQKLIAREWTGLAVYGLLLLGMIGKMTFELFTRSNLFVAVGSFTPVPSAHWIGAAIGLTIAIHSFFSHASVRGDAGQRRQLSN